MRKLAVPVTILMTALLGGCPPWGYRPISRMGNPESSTLCAFGIPGVRVSLVDTERGVDVTLAVVGDATELQRRVHARIEGPSPGDDALARLVHVQIHDHADGLTVHVVAIDPARADEVRAATRRRVEQAKARPCD